MAVAIPHVPNDILRQEKDAMTNNTSSYYRNHITYASAVMHNVFLYAEENALISNLLQ